MQIPLGRASDFEFRYRFWLIGMMFGATFAMYWLDHRNAATMFVHTRRGFHLIFAAAAVVLVLAAMLRTWASAYLHTSVVHDLNLHSEKLVADGPYRFVRNPLYLGSWLLAVGIGLLASRAGWVLATVAMLVYEYRLIAREERELLATQRERFAGYCAKVPRLFPSPWPRVPASGARPLWGQAFMGELYFWCFALGMIGFAVTLDERVPKYVFIAPFVVYSLHFLMLWMEKNDWIYYKRKRPAGSARAALGAMEGFIHPEIQHVIQEQGQRQAAIVNGDIGNDQ